MLLIPPLFLFQTENDCARQMHEISLSFTQHMLDFSEEGIRWEGLR